MRPADDWYDEERASFAREEPRAAVVPVIKAIQDDAQPKWQPIETAPKDGTRILVIDRGESRATGEDFVLIASWDGDLNVWEDDEGIPVEPFAWMPLPERKFPMVAEHPGYLLRTTL